MVVVPRSIPFVLALFAGACSARSEEEIQAEFDAFVAERNECTDTSECVLAGAGCPLGCTVAVNARHEAAVEAKARDLIDEYESSGRNCEYQCVLVTAVCADNRCEEVPQ
jgi:hypothetical protein